jgi:uncharacterized protein YecE (DUF72 family)
VETGELSPIQSAGPVRIGSARVHIGTSGWHYKHWIGDFYPPRFPAAKMLAWYAREFYTVEINNSFYRLPEEKTFKDWAATVPPGFLFAVKASRFLTHIKRLKDAKDPIDLFFSRARHLGPHLGPVLFQLPPKWKADAGRLRDFLQVLPRDYSYAVEFRDDYLVRAGSLSIAAAAQCCALSPRLAFGTVGTGNHSELFIYSFPWNGWTLCR